MKKFVRYLLCFADFSEHTKNEKHICLCYTWFVLFQTRSVRDIIPLGGDRSVCLVVFGDEMM